MDDDDEFGDLYTDVLRPFTDSHPSILYSSSKPDRNSEIDDEDITNIVSSDPNSTLPTNLSNQTKLDKPENTLVFDSSNPNLIQGDGFVQASKQQLDEVSGVRVLENSNVELFVDSTRVSDNLKSSEELGIGVLQVEDNEKNERNERNGSFIDKDAVFIKEEDEEKLDIDVGIDDLGCEPMIPGLSAAPSIPGVFEGEDVRRDGEEDGAGDDWDSDSEDDLQIVLNEKSGPIGMNRNEGMGSDDEDGEDLVIVADGDQPHQPIPDQEWGEDPTQGGDGERKDAGEAAKVNGGLVNTAGTRTGYGNHVYAPHNSQFKYVRPGAAAVPGGPIVGPGSTPGQVRPLVNMGLVVGRGRGDWRPMGIKTAPGMQRPFHSGFGMPAWGNNNSAGRGFGSGLEFTLPSHKTVFDIDIDSFEEKPWRNPAVDLSDFFNFGFDEENWKGYCKQLEQLRLESSMQSRIRVYESGRSEQDYDPDLPPELAAAAGIQDASAENAHLAKPDGGLSDLTDQGRGASRARPSVVPTGRAIQVEGGFGERLPSIDTRPPRMRDSDAIIEIVLQGSEDDDPMPVDDAGNDVQKDGLKEGDDEADDVGQTEYFDRGPQPYNSRKREMVGRREAFASSENNIHETDGLLPFPPDAPLQYNPGSKERAPNYSGGTFGAPQDGRWPQGRTRERYTRQTSDRSNDVIPCESGHGNKGHDSDREKSRDTSEGEQNLEATPSVTGEVARESSIEQKADLQNELEVDENSVAMEGEETSKDVIIPNDGLRDGSPIPSKRQKLSSRVEQPTVEEIGSVDGLRATRSSDNSKARSGSSRDYQKRRDGGEEEVVQEGRSRRTEDIRRRRNEDDHNYRKKDDSGRDGRQEMDRGRVFVKGREDSHVYYPYRDWDLNPTHLSRVKTAEIERPRERDGSVGARQRRDDDTHGRRLKDEDIRKREYFEEIGYRHRSKVRESERNDKDEHLHSRKRLDNGDWRGHHDKDVGPRQRENDDNLMIRHENFDDPHTRRRREEEHLRREHADKEVLHGYKAREDTSRRKRERDDVLDQRKREEQPRVRDKPDDGHSVVRHREDSWRQRERDERRLKQSQEDILSNREREGKSSVRSGRDLEDKSWIGNTRMKDESKAVVSEKDYPYKDRRRPSEHSKRGDRVEDDSFPQHRGRENVYARENQFTNEDRNPRHERSSTHTDRLPNPSDIQLLHKERQRDSRRSKETDRTDQNTLGSSKRKREDHDTHRSEKVSSKIASEQESGNAQTSGHTSSRDPGQLRLSSSTSLSKKNSIEHDVAQQRHSSRKHREDAPSEDEQQNLGKGRSKLERWTSNKDRDDMTNLVSASSKLKDTGKNNIDTSLEVSEHPDDQIGTAGEDQQPVGEESCHDMEMRDAAELTQGGRQAESDKVGDDRHLDTVAKLKKRSERFKIPMPSEKDPTTYRKVESEAFVSNQSEIAADTEVKPERPARKRRWISS